MWILFTFTPRPWNNWFGLENERRVSQRYNFVRDDITTGYIFHIFRFLNYPLFNHNFLIIHYSIIIFKCISFIHYSIRIAEWFSRRHSTNFFCSLQTSGLTFASNSACSLNRHLHNPQFYGSNCTLIVITRKQRNRKTTLLQYLRVFDVVRKIMKSQIK